MKINNNQTTKFSFGTGNLDQIISPTATPKFPSIDFKNNNFGGSDNKSNRPLRRSQEKQISKTVNEEFMSQEKRGEKPTQIFRRQKKRVMKISDKFAPYQIFADTKSVELIDNKSVKSVVSLREKLKKNSRNKSKDSSKSYRSVSNLLVINREVPSIKRQTRHLNIFSKLKSSDQFMPHTTVDKSHPNFKHNEPIRITNNFFVHPIITRGEQLSQNFKLISAFQRNKMTFISQKGKSFKNLLNKTRPVLNLQRRVLTNDRIQTISKHTEDQQFVQYL